MDSGFLLVDLGWALVDTGFPLADFGFLLMVSDSFQEIWLDARRYRTRYNLCVRVVFALIAQVIGTNLEQGVNNL